ncbi:hypothetical protein [Micromonospora sp. WMMC273]|uniref:hypothetical protein n=1 Tax=Micromonospora sp. WMMC273 TaxID=3015157 RepID=UPI0022B71C27|nr:hypothetical protein [Micromonospora sp. WMMC273]MCZ7479011.1 hypothetical protein [Micromonospora sp. WMMC273]
MHKACTTKRPRWSASVLAEVLADPFIRERPWPLVERAFLIAAGTAKTFTPRRLLEDACPHWDQAEKQLVDEAAAVARAAADPVAETPPGGGVPVNVVPEQRAGDSKAKLAAHQAAQEAAARRRLAGAKT